jgi:hypothetical protein
MNTAKHMRLMSLAVLAVSLAAVNARAQDPPQEPTDQTTHPKPAAGGIFTTDVDQDNNNPPIDQMRPDNTPLTGVQLPTLGTTELRHSYWVPGVQVATNIESSGYKSWFTDNYVIGNLSLLEAWSHASFALNYSGGAHFATGNQLQNGQYQELDLSQTFEWNRLTLQFIDEFSYLPQSQFGFGGGTNLGVPGVGGYTGAPIPGLGGNYVPNQSIYAALGPRYSNAAVVQTTYILTRRSSITASGSYGILNFVNPGNVDTRSVIASLGYNHTLSKEDTIGLVYRFSSYHYPGQKDSQAIGDHSFNLAYSRKLTGRLALFVAGGPELTTFRTPVDKATSKLGGTANASLNYATAHGGVMFTYFHGVSGGSGIFTAATVDAGTFGLRHSLSRVWSGQANVGYSHNRAVANLVAIPIPAYNSWFLSAGVSRPIGRSLIFATSYTANIATSASTTGCKVPGSCTSSQTYNFITLSLQWHSRPLILR